MQNDPLVYPIRLGMTSAFLVVQGNHAILVDAGMPGSGARIGAALAAHGVGHGQLGLIIITHTHVDHSGGAAAVQALTGASVAVHPREAEALRSGQSVEVVPRGKIATLATRLMPQPRLTGVEPSVLIEGKTDLAPYGIAGRVIPTPGHTPGSVSVVLANGDAIVGDLIMGAFLRRGQPSLPLFAADVDQVRSSLATVMAMSPRRILAAHGGPFTAADVRRKFAWLVGVQESASAV